MKNFLSMFFSVILIFSLFTVAFAAEDSFNVADAVIVIPQNASETDAYAAQRLKYYLDENDIERIEDIYGRA